MQFNVGKEKDAMKKIISLMAAIFILACSCADAVYLPQDVRGTEFEADTELLINLGMFSYNEDGMLKPYSHMTKAEFADILNNVIKNDIGSAEQDIFVDVNKNHPSRESINRLYSLGYINGDGNSYFHADDDITYNEAVRIMVSVIGYDKYAQYNGGYPSGYLSAASSIGITKGISADGEYINRGNVIRLISNCFDANPAEVVFENGTMSVKVNKDTTVLAELADIYSVKDYVNSNSDYGISGGLSKKGYITVGAEEMAASDEYKDYTGYYVTCWYKKDDDEREVLYIRPNESKNIYKKAESKDVVSEEEYGCIITEDGKEKRIRFSGSTTFVYNGKGCKNFKPEMLKPTNGWVEFLDNNSDGTYELVKISEYYNIVTEIVGEDIIYDKYSDNSIKTEDIDLYIFDDSGSKIGISNIASGDVLSVFKSESGTDDIIKLVRSRKTVTGDVSGKFVEDGITYAQISGVKYPVYSGYRTSSTADIYVRDSGEFMLDAYGKIVSMKGFAAGVEKPAYLIQVKAYADENTAEEIIRFKLLGETGVVYLTAEEKIKADGILYKDTDFESLAKSLQSSVNKVIIYKLNNKGHIKTVDTVEQNMAGDRDDRLSVGPSAENTGLRYKSATKVFEGKIAIDNDTKVFIVPSDPQKADNSAFSFRDTSYFLSDQSYKGLVTYRSEKNKIPVDYVVLQAANSIINNESDVAVIKSIAKTINEDDEMVMQLNVFADGADKSFITAAEKTGENLKYITKYSRAGDSMAEFEEGAMPKLGAGDIIKYSFDANGAIDSIALIYSAENKKMYSVNPYHTDFHEKGQRYVMGEVNKKYEGYAELDVGGNIECHNIGSADIYEVFPNKKEVLKKISQAEIKSAEKNGTGDTLIVITVAGAQKMTLLYRGEE